MGLIKAGLYIGAASYIINKITDEKKNHKANSAPQNTTYPPSQQYQDSRGYPPHYEQYSAAPPQQQYQQKSAYHDTNAQYETQYQASPPSQYSREERSEQARQSKIEDGPTPRQWPEAQPAKSSKW